MLPELSFDSVWSSGFIYMRQWVRPSRLQAMARNLFVARPLPNAGLLFESLEQHFSEI